MSFPSGHHLAHYEIVEPIGKGGMGEVYRAKDTKLGRDVAIKVLPEEFARDEERLRRFEREAKVLASLNHPNIGGIHGLEAFEGTHFLVLELVPGETLAERLMRGTLPVEEAVAIASQIAEALEAAHAKGIIHRDLKPANVKLTPDDQAVVLDFGLAKALFEDGAEPEAATSRSPTITRDATRAGVILGTAAYMSPEQARGKPVDKRADIWAFGAVMFEMLTGKRAFAGEDVSDVLASVIKLDPDWSALAAGVPLRLREVLVRCLEKDPRRRWRDIGDVSVLMEMAGSMPVAEAKPKAPKPASALVWAGWVVAAFALAALWWVPSPASDGVVKTRLSVEPAAWLGAVPPGTVGANRGLSRTAFALSPDGGTMVFSAGDDGGSRLYRRSLDVFDAVPIENTEGAFGPFLSPDGRWIGFWADGYVKKVPIDGGPAVELCEIPRPPSGASWDVTETILFALQSRGVFEVSSNGGEPRAVTSLADGEYAHRLPSLLPNGEWLLFTVKNRQRSWDDATVVAQSMRSGERKVLVENGADGRYVPSGHLVFVRQGTLMAVSMDAARIEVRGGAVGLLDGVLQAINTGNGTWDTGAGQWRVSASGSLAYVPGGIFPDAEQALVWVNRDGESENLPVETDRYIYPRISPDGRRAAIVRVEETSRDVWILDLETAAWRRLTFGAGTTPVWLPDGTRIAFGSNRSGQDQTYWVPADGSGPAERFTTSEPPDSRPASWSPDGELLLALVNRGGHRDILTIDLTGEARAYIESPFRERFPTFSPDGRWVAYRSDESGEREVYVTAFPGPGPRIPISSGHGGEWSAEPAWSRDGRELYYLADAGDGSVAMKVVAVEDSNDFTDVRPRTLFEITDYAETASLRNYDVSPDGRFLVVRNLDRNLEPVTEIHLVQNWLTELERLVPTDE